MESVYYEAHHHPEPDFPVIFRFDTVRGPEKAGCLHWHEALEFLWCAEGEGVVVSDEEQLPFSPGDLVVVDANRLHTVYTQRGLCRYYCLIPSPSLFEHTDLPTGRLPILPRVTDAEALALMKRIVREMETRAPYYREAVRALIAGLYVALYRTGVKTDSAPRNSAGASGPELVKRIVSYACSHYTEPFSMDSLCREMGFSKPYVCHIFKKVTGQTVLSYVNFLRCTHARTLLASGKYNVGESALLSGFANLSYFSRTYRRVMGSLPSEQRGQAKEQESRLVNFPKSP